MDEITSRQSKNQNKVSIRNGFSDRNGIKPENKTQQYTEFNDQTRVHLLNLLNSSICSVYGRPASGELTQSFIRDILSNVYSREVVYNRYYYHLDELLQMISDTIRNDDYDSVLSVIEYVCCKICSDSHAEYVRANFNAEFEREYVGYRFVGEQIVQITSEYEIEALQRALEDSADAVRQHLEKALRLISDRTNPDYAESVKESIGAVEAECCRILGARGTLAEALQKIESRGIRIPSGMRDAFERLYAYTSDEKGIRHAADIGAADSTFAEASYMLVACSAFINYIKTVSSGN